MSGHLSLREARILQNIVEAYLESGEPVASLGLARAPGTTLSAASIRNTMQDLGEQGYLQQPHASAGRIPTPKALQYYVKSLAVRVVSAELARMRAELSRAQTAEQRIERSSQILTELTQNVGIVAAIPVNGQLLHSVEFVALPAGKVMMVVITTDGRVRNQVIEIAEPIPDFELVAIRNYLNQNFSGWRLPDVRRELENRFQQESVTYDSVLRRLVDLQVGGLLELALDPEVHLDGAFTLVGVDLHLTRTAMQELFRTLEQKRRLLDLLERYLAQEEAGQPAVQVGLEEANPALAGLSMVGITLEEPSGLATRMAVLGPTRMNYAKALSAVMHLQRALRSLPS